MGTEKTAHAPKFGLGRDNSVGNDRERMNEIMKGDVIDIQTGVKSPWLECTFRERNQWTRHG